MDPQGISLFNHEKMHFLQLENLIGQFPFSSPTVFNFFFADYDLPMSDADITAASPEPESEEEEVEEEKMSNELLCRCVELAELNKPTTKTPLSSSSNHMLSPTRSRRRSYRTVLR